MPAKLGAKIWYLAHSGFAVQTAGNFLVFDYSNPAPCKEGRGLKSGVIDQEEISKFNVMFFASHAHGDHFNPEILELDKKIKNLHFVLSHDIGRRRVRNLTLAHPNQEYQINGVFVRTLESTDEGVAFIVEVDGLKIYHAGDLNWWHWEDEPDEENQAMARRYKGQIDMLKDESFDFAFVPVDTRLSDAYLWGLDYLMGTVNVNMVFPMHFWENYDVFDSLFSDERTSRYRDRIVRISHRGERFVYSG
ncbi:MAG: MBL fold metallo-hydrolase [Clostridiales bacterium]|jgi:L-ascorbate metabolism protein UlaG (beta-lactamase superfamily)|nr:MBL fold metallo-hydrolase [Clostridiales bacterium]